MTAPTKLNTGNSRPVTSFEVLNAENPQVEREQLNRILRELSTRTGGTAGADGATGARGPAGADGADGVGVPAGGTTGQVLEKASNTDYDTQWVTPSAGGRINPRNETYFFDDFYAKPPNNLNPAAANNQSWVVTSYPTAASITSLSDVADGVWQMNCGTNTNAVLNICLGVGSAANGQNFKLGDGAISFSWRFRVPTLSDGTNTFSIGLGFRDNLTGAVNEGLYFVYGSTINSGRATLRAVTGGTPTDANGTTTLVANTFYNVRVEVNAALTSASLYLDDVLEATLSSGFPASQHLIYGAIIVKSAGSTARTLDLDYTELYKSYTSPR